MPTVRGRALVNTTSTMVSRSRAARCSGPPLSEGTGPPFPSIRANCLGLRIMRPMDDQIEFPPVSSATDDGLLMVGGRLNPAWVLAAYRRGIFPWPIVDQGYDLLAWFSPDPRAIIELDSLYISRRLARRIRSGCFRVSCDEDFVGVMAGCAAPRKPFGETWITPAMRRTYERLFHLGYAHSIEVWANTELVGGLYGIGLGAFFAGESMFHRQRDASKVAMAYLVGHLRSRGYEMFDVQQATRHAVRMGAMEIPRPEFLQRLQRALRAPVSFGRQLETTWLSQMLTR